MIFKIKESNKLLSATEDDILNYDVLPVIGKSIKNKLNRSNSSLKSSLEEISEDGQKPIVFLDKIEEEETMEFGSPSWGFKTNPFTINAIEFYIQLHKDVKLSFESFNFIFKYRIVNKKNHEITYDIPTLILNDRFVKYEGKYNYIFVKIPTEHSKNHIGNLEIILNAQNDVIRGITFNKILNDSQIALKVFNEHKEEVIEKNDNVIIICDGNITDCLRSVTFYDSIKNKNKNAVLFDELGSLYGINCHKINKNYSQDRFTVNFKNNHKIKIFSLH